MKTTDDRNELIQAFSIFFTAMLAGPTGLRHHNLRMKQQSEPIAERGGSESSITDIVYVR